MVRAIAEMKTPLADPSNGFFPKTRLQTHF